MRTVLSLTLLCAFLALPLAAATAAEHIATGEAAYDRGDFDAAVRAFESAAALEPGNAKVHYTLGTVYGRQAQKASLFKMASLAKKAK